MQIRIEQLDIHLLAFQAKNYSKVALVAENSMVEFI